MKYLLPLLLLSPMALGKTSQIKIGGKCLDVPNGQMVNSAKLQLWDCNKSPAQQFEIVDSETPATNPPPTEEPKGKCVGIPAWKTPNNYNVGDVVVYKNQLFTAINDKNPGYDPLVSTWFWRAGDKCDAVVVNPPPIIDPPPVVNPPPASDGSKEIGVYLQSWSCSWVSSAAQHCLATIPAYVNTILVAFSRPDSNYVAGSTGTYGAGLDFSADRLVVRDAVKIAQAKGQKVLLSVGGATYTGFANLNVGAIKALADDLGMDGVDLDWEGDQVCSWGTGGNSCPKDAELISAIRSLRAAFPRPKLLTAAVWSTGALGPAPYEPSKFKGNLIGGNFGSWVNALKQAGSDMDKLYVMSYDCGGPNAPAGSPTGCDPKTLTNAYKALFKGPVIPGQEGGQQAWGGHVNTASETADLAKTYGSVFFWSWQKPDTLTLIRAACSALGKVGCDQASLISERSFHVKSTDAKKTKL